MDYQIKGKRALVTGSSGGIGKATAALLPQALNVAKRFVR